MNIGILGTGMVGRAHAARLVDNGHNVMLGTRDPAASLARTETDFMGNPPLSVWRDSESSACNSARSLRRPRSARSSSTPYSASVRASTPYSWQGRRTSPARSSSTSPTPSSSRKAANPRSSSAAPTPSASSIQRLACPRLKVVKTLNTDRPLPVQVDPALAAGGDHRVFVSGNDAQAKADVVCFLRGTVRAAHRRHRPGGHHHRPRGTRCCCPCGSGCSAYTAFRCSASRSQDCRANDPQDPRRPGRQPQPGQPREPPSASWSPAGYAACELDFEGGFWLEPDECGQRFGHLAAAADIALSVHAPLPAFLGHLDRGQKYQRALGMLDHTATHRPAERRRLGRHPPRLPARAPARGGSAGGRRSAWPNCGSVWRRRIASVPFGVELMGRVRDLGSAPRTSSGSPSDSQLGPPGDRLRSPARGHRRRPDRCRRLRLGA